MQPFNLNDEVNSKNDSGNSADFETPPTKKKQLSASKQGNIESGRQSLQAGRQERKPADHSSRLNPPSRTGAGAGDRMKSSNAQLMEGGRTGKRSSLKTTNSPSTRHGDDYDNKKYEDDRINGSNRKNLKQPIKQLNDGLNNSSGRKRRRKDRNHEDADKRIDDHVNDHGISSQTHRSRSELEHEPKREPFVDAGASLRECAREAQLTGEFAGGVIVSQKTIECLLAPDPTDSEAEKNRNKDKSKEGRNSVLGRRVSGSKNRSESMKSKRSKRQGGFRASTDYIDDSDEEDNDRNYVSSSRRRAKKHSNKSTPNTSRTRQQGNDNNSDVDNTLLSSDGEWKRQKPRMKIVVEAIGQRKKPQKKKEYAERLFTMMESEELTTIRIAFEEFYPKPPNNLQAQATMERELGIELTPNMRNGMWENQLKPWSEKWWTLYHRFNDEAREKKKQKSRTTKPTVKETEARRWAKAFFEQHGPAKPADMWSKEAKEKQEKQEQSKSG